MIELTSYDPRFDEELTAFDVQMAAEIRFHGDVMPESVCIALADGQVAGVAYIIRHATFLHLRKNLEYYYLHGVCKALPGHPEEVEISDALLEDLKETYRRTQAEHPGKRIALRMWCGAEKTDYAEYLMAHGFKMSRIMPVMVRKLNGGTENEKPADGQNDLTGTDELRKHFPLPDGYEIREMQLTDDFTAEYRKVNGAAFSLPDSMEELRFYTAGGARIFAVTRGESLAAALTTWRVSDTRAATENIFCRPSLKRKGLTSALIVHVLNLLKEEGYEEASLSLFGENQPAFQLYEKLGYEVQGFILEALYEADRSFRPY